MFPKNSFFESVLFQITGQDIQIKDAIPVNGGDINEAVKIVSSSGTYFLKYNASDIGDLFEKEMLGLDLLRSNGTLAVPETYGIGIASGKSYLIMQYIQAEAPNHNFWQHFGQSLAALHQNTQPRFGLDHDNHIGKLSQKNTYCDNWVDFFIHNRLEVQLGLALYNQHINQSFVDSYRKIYAQLPEIFPDESPALLHGDLWSGNFMCGPGTKPWIYDPASYYGHREMELAFTRLFGGFDQQFYDSYDEVLPLEPGFSERIDVYNLYPLLVHVNLFGPSYLTGIQRTLRRFL